MPAFLSFSLIKLTKTSPLSLSRPLWVRSYTRSALFLFAGRTMRSTSKPTAAICTRRANAVLALWYIMMVRIYQDYLFPNVSSTKLKLIEILHTRFCVEERHTLRSRLYVLFVIVMENQLQIVVFTEKILGRLTKGYFHKNYDKIRRLLIKRRYLVLK